MSERSEIGPSGNRVEARRSPDTEDGEHRVNATDVPHDELIEQLRAGNHDAFRAVWDAHHVRLATFAYRYLDSQDAAADVVQHVFVSLWEGRERLRVKSTITNYLYAAVRNRIGNLAHHDRVVRAYSNRMATHYLADRAAMSPERPDVAIEAAELGHSMQRALETLPPRTREIFLLSRAEGMSPTDIASLLGITVQVVYNQLTRALKRLSEALSEIA